MATLKMFDEIVRERCGTLPKKIELPSTSVDETMIGVGRRIKAVSIPCESGLGDFSDHVSYGPRKV